MEFAGQLNAMLEKKGVSAYRLSKETGISQSLISDWKKGKASPGSDKLLLLAEYFGVSCDALLGSDIPTDAISRVPVLGTIRAGLPVFCEENIEGYELAGVREPENYFYLRVKGDSMVNAGIRDGSLVLVRRQNYAEDGQIVVCLVDGDSTTLKRFCPDGDKVWLVPENPSYQPVVLQAADFAENRARVLGVAVSVTTEL